MFKYTYLNTDNQLVTTTTPSRHLVPQHGGDEMDLFTDEFEHHDLNSLLKRAGFLTVHTECPIDHVDKPVYTGDILIGTSNFGHDTYVITPYLGKYHTIRYHVLLHDGIAQYIPDDFDYQVMRDITRLYDQFEKDEINDLDLIDNQGLRFKLYDQNIAQIEHDEAHQIARDLKLVDSDRRIILNTIAKDQHKLMQKVQPRFI